MELAVLDIKGKETSKKVLLHDEIFAVEPNDHAIYLDVKQFLANKRQGTHKAKPRAEIAGSTRKIKKQKGTGGARAGSVKSGTRVGGGRIFGPEPRDYSFKLNKKTKQVARKSALTYKARENAITVLENVNFEAPRTKEYITLLANLKLSDKKSLVVTGDNNKALYLSSRNLKRTKVVSVSDLNTYDLMNATNVVFLEDTLSRIEDTFTK
jgi:large subunit ribosomal protein L4